MLVWEGNNRKIRRFGLKPGHRYSTLHARQWTSPQHRINHILVVLVHWGAVSHILAMPKVFLGQDVCAMTSRQQDTCNHIRLVHLKNLFQTASLTELHFPHLRPIGLRTERNPDIRPVLFQRHRTAKLQRFSRDSRMEFCSQMGRVSPKQQWRPLWGLFDDKENIFVILALCNVVRLVAGSSWCGEASLHMGGQRL